MATICFRPPPLPPNKKSSLLTNSNRVKNKQNHGLLSSTYLSFRDPAEDEILTCEEVELVELKKDATVAGKKCRKVSHSDGNLSKKASSSPLSINRYMKVLSGSWRNLLN
ncbi:hypothetical protein NQ317_005363, partial [Molorchus minor]